MDCSFDLRWELTITMFLLLLIVLNVGLIVLNVGLWIGCLLPKEGKVGEGINTDVDIVL